MKTTTKPQTKRSPRTKKIEIENDEMNASFENDVLEESSSTQSYSPTPHQKSKVGMILLFLLIVVGALGYKYRYFLTPATVNGKPIYVWEYMQKLHEQYGQDQINALTTERMIRQAVASANVTVPKEDIEKEIATVEQQASSSGGLQAILSAQRMSMTEFRTRIELQLAVKKILADKIVVADQEVEDTYKKNKDFYKGMSDADAKNQVRTQLEDQKFQTEVSKWLSDVRTNAKVEIKFPGLTNPTSIQ